VLKSALSPAQSFRDKGEERGEREGEAGVEGEMKRDTWMQIVFYAAPRTRILARTNGDVMNRIYLRGDTISRRGSETTSEYRVKVFLHSRRKTPDR